MTRLKPEVQLPDIRTKPSLSSLFGFSMLYLPSMIVFTVNSREAEFRIRIFWSDTDPIFLGAKLLYEQVCHTLTLSQSHEITFICPISFKMTIENVSKCVCVRCIFVTHSVQQSQVSFFLPVCLALNLSSVYQLIYLLFSIFSFCLFHICHLVG